MDKATKKKQEQEQINREQSEILSNYQQQLAEYYMDQKKIVSEEKEARDRMRKAYKEEANLRKYKYRMGKRQQLKSSAEVRYSLKSYAKNIMWMSTDDERVFAYQRKMWKELWKEYLSQGPIFAIISYLIVRGVRRLKKASPLDIPIYGGLMMVAMLQGGFHMAGAQMFEIGFPAHPQVIENRRKCINECCFYSPGMLKNEIEYIHSKIAQHAEASDRSTEAVRFEKVFETGSLQKKGIEKPRKKFKIVVDEGELYLDCMDSFEDIFELNHKLLEGLELTEVLDPYMFDNHRDIVNALFETYYLLGQEYMDTFHDKKAVSSLKQAAIEKVERKYGIGRFKSGVKNGEPGSTIAWSGEASATAKAGKLDYTDKEAVALVEMEDTKQLLQDTSAVFRNQRQK